MLVASSISKRYGSFSALRDVSLSLEKGQVMGLLGKNGAGKSTLMNVLTGYIGPTEGSVTLDGVSLMDDPEVFKRRIGYLPEIPPLYQDMTVFEQLRFAASIKGIRHAGQKAAIETALSKADVLDHGKRLIRHLSKGYKQRVGLAQAMLGEPEVLILDEPSAGLDPAQIAQMRDTVRQYASQHAALVSSHILSEVSDLCDTIVVLDRGSVRASDTLTHLLAGQANRQWLRYKGDAALLASIGEIAGVDRVEQQTSAETGCVDALVVLSPDTDARGEIAQILADKGAPLLMLRPWQAALEDVFLTLTGSGASV